MGLMNPNGPTQHHWLRPLLLAVPAVPCLLPPTKEGEVASVALRLHCIAARIAFTAMVLLFLDLSLLPSSTSTSTNSRLLAAARALELGYAAVALDHPHRGLLADSDRCRLAPFPALSSLPLPSSASLHRRLNGSPTAEPFRQYTRVTLALDSAAAAASALAPSASRLLRTYDIVAARPLTQAAFDHLCQAQHAADLDIISIDFSQKVPFRLKLPMLKLALQRGIHFEIAYSPLVNDVNSRRQVLAEAKLLVDWTKGKNLIISSAAHNANEIRGPYDVINLCAYLLGLSTQRAKAAISINCRSLISKALRKKHFYKETIRIDKLLPNEQLNSTNYKLGDWIGWGPISFKGDLQPLERNLEPSSNKDERLGSPINSTIKMLDEKRRDADMNLFAEQLEQSTDDEEIPDETQEGTVQVSGGEALMNCGLPTLLASFCHQNVARDATLDKPINNEIVTGHNVQAGPAASVDRKSIDEHVEFVQDAMEIDATEPCTSNLIAGDCDHLSSGVMLACSGCTSGEREDRAPLDHKIPSGSNGCLGYKGLDKLGDILVHLEAHRDTTESLGFSPGGRDDEAPLTPAVQLSSDLCKDIVLPQQVMEDIIEQNMNENIEQTMRDKEEPVDGKARRMISVEHTPLGQETCSTASVYNRRSRDTACENDGCKEPNSGETNTSLEKDVAKIHGQLLNYSYAGGKVEISTCRPEKRRQKLWPHRPAYLPFLGFLKPVAFKKRVCKVASNRKS